MEPFYHGDMLKMLSLIYRKMQIHISRSGRRYGLSSGMVPFVMLTCENGEMPQNRFCTLLDISKGTAARTLAKLEEQGYVRREENAADGRSVMVYPTEKARTVYPRLTEAGDAWVSQMTQGMSEEEKAAFLELLRRVSGNISSWF